MVFEMVEPALPTFEAGLRLTSAEAVEASTSAEARVAASAEVEDRMARGDGKADRFGPSRGRARRVLKLRWRGLGTQKRCGYVADGSEERGLSRPSILVTIRDALV